MQCELAGKLLHVCCTANNQRVQVIVRLYTIQLCKYGKEDSIYTICIDPVVALPQLLYRQQYVFGKKAPGYLGHAINKLDYYY